jgi:hypothetical protein
LKLQKRNLVVVETVAVVAVDAEMVLLLEENSKETEIVLRAAVMVEIVVKVVLDVIEMVDVIVTVVVIVVQEVMLEVEKVVHVAKVVSTEMQLHAEKAEVVLVEVAQDRSVNRSTKNKLIKHFV